MPNAEIIEIFSSIQGEGPWVGQRQIFVRFKGCAIACRYCDTRQGSISTSSVQVSPGSFSQEQVDASVSGERLTALCKRLVVPGPSKPWISLTGGEPLLQHAFLRSWLAEMRDSFQIYLETSGIHYRAMADVAHLIDTISMDLKLPSATGLRPFWQEHEQFLAAAGNKRLYGKAVVTRDTTEQDLLHAVRLFSRFDRERPFVIQPATGTLAAGPDQLIRFQNDALALLADVRVIPQVHPLLKVP